MPVVIDISLVLSVLSTSLGGFIVWWFTKVNKELDNLRKQIMEIRLNYLDRFEDLKDHISKGNLEIIQRISKLEGQKTENK